jgi:hypothetical protein
LESDVAELDALEARLNRALDRIEHAVAERGTLAREHEALSAAHQALEERCGGLEQAGKDVSSRLSGAIAGIDRLLRPQARKDSAPQ